MKREVSPHMDRQTAIATRQAKLLSHRLFVKLPCGLCGFLSVSLALLLSQFTHTTGNVRTRALVPPPVTPTTRNRFQ